MYVVSFQFHNGSCSRQNQDENNARPDPEPIPLVNGGPDHEFIVNGNDDLDQGQNAPPPFREQPLNINANNAALLNLAEAFADRVDEGAVIHSDAVQDGSRNVTHHLNMAINNGEDVNHYLTSRQALHEVQAATTRRVLQEVIDGLADPVNELTLTALRTIVETAMQALSPAE